MVSATYHPIEALGPLPEIDLRQMQSLTDGTAMLQHAAFATPDLHHGYCTDDNARALIAATLYSLLRDYDENIVPIQRYLAFLAYAFSPDTGRFRNFMGYDRQWLEEIGSEDSHGRTVWGLGVAVRYAPNDAIREISERLFHQALPCLASFKHAHPLAFALIGLDEHLKFRPDDREIATLREQLAERLFAQWRANASDDWPWWDDILTWGNGKLPHALLVSGVALGREDMRDVGLRTLQWVLDAQRAPEGHLTIIGNHGWYSRGGKRAQFDQQPLEAHALVHACLAAAELTGEQQWLSEARRCFDWFMGKNDLNVPVYHPDTGGCQDGLTPNGANANQGAESTLAYLLSVLEVHRYCAEHAPVVTVEGPAVLGYGLIGASRFAEFCLEQYSRLPGVELLGVWNRTAQKAARIAARYRMRHCESLEELVGDPRITLVHVATTPALHAEHAHAALAAGKHVLCEKPLATDLGDADRLLQAAREKDVRLSVNFMMRYGPLWAPVQQLIERQILGALLHGQLFNCAGDAGLAEGHWFWDESQSGGIFVEHGVHFFDLARSWLGGGTVIEAFRLNRPGTGLIDQVRCGVRYGEQTTLGFYHGFHQASMLDRQELKLVFEHGELTLRGWVAYELEARATVDRARRAGLLELFPEGHVRALRRFKGEERIYLRRGQEETANALVRLHWSAGEDSQEIYGAALRDLLEDVLAGIRDKDHCPRVTGEDGREALAIALEADRLSKRGAAP